MDLAHEVGERIRRIRKERGMTQDALAQAVGVSRSAVAQWETGRAGQLSQNLTRIADAMNVGVEYLLYGEASQVRYDPGTADELALIRLYRECSPPDKQVLLRLARRLAVPQL